MNEAKPKKKINSFFGKTAMVFTHISAASMLFSYLASYISPANFWPIAFLGLAYPILLLVNLFFFSYWLFLLKKRCLYPLVIILIGWPQLQATFQVNSKIALIEKSSVIKIMSYNVKVFDLYNWTHNLETQNKIFNLIKIENADIVCFQEFFSRDTIKFNNMDTILSFPKSKFVHVEYTINDKYKQHFGIATFTNYPIIKRGKLNFPRKNNNLCIYTDVLINNDTVRIYNMHLQSIAFSKSDYKYAEDLKNNIETEDIENSKNILRRIKRAFVKRSQQADIINESIQNCRYPVIVCGDFNDTPSSYTYSKISENLNDSFIESGNGFGQTYAGSFPSFRIDYILHSKTFESLQFKTLREELSDHYPIVSYINPKN